VRLVSRTGCYRRAAWCALLFLGLPVAGTPQGPAAGSGSASRDVERPVTNILVHSDLVLIPVTVTDGKGRIVTGLQKEQFSLYEDKVEQDITHFDTEDAPASIGLVFDASDSMEPKLDKAREAVNALLDKSNPNDEFFLVRFSTHPELMARLTTNRDQIRRRVESLETGGSTALLDAVLLAMGELKNARYTRKAIIIISDGEDNSSQCPVSRFREAVRQSDVLIYAIGISDSNGFSQSFSSSSRLSGSALLDDISKQTGGRLFTVTRLKQLPEIATTIGSWLRSQYVLGYAPSSSDKDGKYRRIQVKLTRPKGFPKMHAIWRLGYYAPAE
jgi:Ca-activated chloride channel homolog